MGKMVATKLKATVMGPVRTEFPSMGCHPVRFEYNCPDCKKPQDIVYDVTPLELADVRRQGMIRPELWQCETCQADWADFMWCRTP